jgi:hypothetical protein
MAWRFLIPTPYPCEPIQRFSGSGAPDLALRRDWLYAYCDEFYTAAV